MFMIGLAHCAVNHFLSLGFVNPSVARMNALTVSCLFLPPSSFLLLWFRFTDILTVLFSLLYKTIQRMITSSCVATFLSNKSLCPFSSETYNTLVIHLYGPHKGFHLWVISDAMYNKAVCQGLCIWSAMGHFVLHFLATIKETKHKEKDHHWNTCNFILEETRDYVWFINMEAWFVHICEVKTQEIRSFVAYILRMLIYFL